MTNYLNLITMKKFIKSPLNLFVAGLIVASSFAFVQCKKEDTKGQISFTYLSDGKPVAGALVTLYIDTSNTDAGFFLCNSNNVITPKKEYVTNSSGVMTRPIWILMNKLPMLKDALCGNLENSEWLYERVINIPSSVRL